MSFNSLEGFEISNGLRKAGLVGVPVNYRLRGSEIAYVLNDSGAKVVVAGPELVDFVDAAGTEAAGNPRFVALGERAPTGWLSYEQLMAESPGLPAPASEGGALGASMIYTSGTTGHPKGAWRPNGVDIENVLQVISIFELSGTDVHLMCGPGYHSAVAFFSALHQVLGATIVVQPKFEAEGALELIARHHVTTTFMAPTLLQRLVDAQVRKPRDVASLRALILGAAPCPYALKVRADAAFGQAVWEFYGATEANAGLINNLDRVGALGFIPRFRCILLSDLLLETMTDEEIEATLTAVPGIGPWTAHGFLIVALDRPDVLLSGDLALRRAVQRAYGFRPPSNRGRDGPGSRAMAPLSEPRGQLSVRVRFRERCHEQSVHPDV